jgi:hypothetical protein
MDKIQKRRLCQCSTKADANGKDRIRNVLLGLKEEQGAEILLTQFGVQNADTKRYVHRRYVPQTAGVKKSQSWYKRSS